MSDNDQNLDDLEDSLDDTDQGDNDTDADSDGDAGQGPDAGQDGATDNKRISDLMSKWQKAEARAAKAEADLAKKGAQGAATGGNAGQEWLELFREQARDQIYRSDPRLAEYGIDPSSISGDTPAAMRESAALVIALVDKLETGVQDRVMKRHGLSPEVKSGPTSKGKSYADMSDEEIEKELARAKGL